jgi:hypothetical protein
MLVLRFETSGSHGLQIYSQLGIIQCMHERTSISRESPIPQSLWWLAQAYVVAHACSASDYREAEKTKTSSYE